MKFNPYKYKGPLEPVRDKLVCVPREEEISKLINGIRRGDYWTILGPRQIGKTTLLRQLQHIFPKAHYLYFNFEISHSNENNFYQSLMDQFFTEIPSARRKPSTKKWKGNPELNFFDFLIKFKPKDDNKKIILMFDEIDSLPFLKTFLHLWRMIYHERYYKKVLNRYVVIITGAVDLIAKTIGKTSPFNIAEILSMKDFSETESRQLVDEPFKYLNIQIEEKAKQKLISQVSGHPQLLQHACFTLVETAADNPHKPLTEQDVDNAFQALIVTNSSLETLKEDLSRDAFLKKLIKDILDGKKKKYYPYKDFSIAGAGSILERDGYCAIRNNVYEEFLKNLFAVNQ